MATKAAAIDFSKILSSGIGKETQAQIVAFRKRADEARRALANLQNQPTSVDLSHYKSVLKVRDSTRQLTSQNQSVVSQAEKILGEFKPVTYDVNAQVKAIESFEATAVCISRYTRQDADTMRAFLACDYNYR